MFSRERIKSLCESEGAAVVSQKFCEAVAAKTIPVGQVSIRTLAEGFLGEDVVRSWGQTRGGLVQLVEAGDPVNMRAFANSIVGIIAASMESGYRRPGFIGDQLVSVVQTPNRFDRISFPGDFNATDADVGEAEEIPTVGFGEQYVDTPDTTKKGAIVGVSREMILADQGGKVVEQASMVGELIGEQKEVKILKMVLGITNTYKFNGTSYNTYQTTQWTNTGTNELVDHSNLEAAEIVLSNMRNPVSSKPIMVMPDTIIVPTAKALTASRVASSPTIEVRSSSGANILTQANPYAARYSGRVFTSPWILKLLTDASVSASDAAKYWYCGESRRAFQYRENWALQVRPIGPDAKREVDLQYAATERGSATVREPRYMYKGT